MSELKFERDSRFLDHLDFVRDGKWSQYTLTVKGITDKGHFKNERDNKPIDKFALQFEKTDKVLLLGTTNSKLAQLVLGDCRASAIKGKQLTIYPVVGKWTMGNYGIRIRCDEWKEHGIAAHHMGRDLTGQPVNEKKESK